MNLSLFFVAIQAIIKTWMGYMCSKFAVAIDIILLVEEEATKGTENIYSTNIDKLMHITENNVEKSMVNLVSIVQDIRNFIALFNQ